MSPISIPESYQAVAWTVPVPSLRPTAEHCRDSNTGKESRFEPDDRSLVDQSDIRDGGKYRSIVKIQAQFKDADGQFVWTMGTGWLIGPDVLVTAGHVVYDHSNNFGATTQIKCYIGYNGRDSVGLDDVQARYGLNVVTTPQWINDGNNRLRDLAFIQVHKPFAGQLRNFRFRNTPDESQSGESGLSIGIVGYPGDKFLRSHDGTDDYGAQMFEEFRRIKYNVETQAQHMIEYRQSGAPILCKQDGLIAIGTHCYGGGGRDGNSGNSIKGKWGNDYDTFTKYLDGGMAEIRAKQGLYILGSTQSTPSGGGEQGPESFGDFFKTAARIASKVVPVASPLLGPVGGLVGTVVEDLLPLTIDATTKGPCERLLLAQGAFEALVSLGNSDGAYEIRKKLEADWNSNTANIDFDVLARSLTPALIRSALELASNRLVLISNGEAPATPLKNKDIVLSKPESLKGTGGQEAGVPVTPFTESLLGPTRGIAGQESVFDWLGPVLKAATSPTAKVMVNGVGQSSLARLSDRLANALSQAESIAESPLTPDERATRLLLKRAVLADMTLQAFMALSRDKLDKLQKDDYETGEAEGLIDLIKTGVQRLGPIALDAAKSHLPALLDAAARKIGVKTESLLSSPENPDLVNNSLDSLTANLVPNGVVKLVPNGVITLVEKEEADEVDERNRLDENPDRPVMEVAPPADFAP